MSVFSSILLFLRRIFSPKTASDIATAVQVAAPYVQIAMPIVEQIASLTATRTDDSIIAAYHHFGVDQLFVPGADTSVQLRDLAVNVVKSSVKDPVATSVLNLAIELAVAAVKAQ